MVETFRYRKDIAPRRANEILAPQGGNTMRHLAAAALAFTASLAHADAVVDWNIRANEVVVESKAGTPPAMRIMAIVQTAVYQAAAEAERSAALDAAVAAANRATLVKLLPAQPVAYRPFAAAGTYVPTASPAVP